MPVRQLQRELTQAEFNELKVLNRHWSLDVEGWSQAAKVCQTMQGLFIEKGKLLPSLNSFMDLTSIEDFEESYKQWQSEN